MVDDKLLTQMICKQPDSPEKNCRNCYMEKNGLCLYCELPIVSGYRCGLWIEKHDAKRR